MGRRVMIKRWVTKSFWGLGSALACSGALPSLACSPPFKHKASCAASHLLGPLWLQQVYLGSPGLSLGPCESDATRPFRDRRADTFVRAHANTHRGACFGFLPSKGCTDSSVISIVFHVLISTLMFISLVLIFVFCCPPRPVESLV